MPPPRFILRVVSRGLSLQNLGSAGVGKIQFPVGHKIIQIFYTYHTYKGYVTILVVYQEFRRFLNIPYGGW